jgi:hypothetical protein
MIYEAYERKEDGLSSRCLDDGGFADAGGVEVNVSTFFSSFGRDIKVEYLNNVSYEVRELP